MLGVVCDGGPTPTSFRNIIEDGPNALYFTAECYVQGPWSPNSAGSVAVLCDDCPDPKIHKPALAPRYCTSTTEDLPP
jgi:hypothetical protein